MIASQARRRRTALARSRWSWGLGLAACAGAGSSGTAGAGTPVQGGTAYLAEQPLSPPNYIFPLVSGAVLHLANTNDLQTLMYRPLYWYGDREHRPSTTALSLGNPPVYSDHDRVVTITLKHYAWSDGETVTARDVGFWINLLKANKADWASYVPGGFPDNVVSWRALRPRTVRLRLNRSYNPFWFTYNELSQITPLPMAWDRTSLSAPGAVAQPPRACPTPPPPARGPCTLPEHPGDQDRPLRVQPDLVGRRRPVEADQPDQRRHGDVRAQPELLRPGQAAPGEVRRAAVHVARRPSSRCCGPARPPAAPAARGSRSRSATCPTTTCRSSPP